MRRIILWLMGTVTSVVLLFSYGTSTSGPLLAAAGTPAAGPATQSGKGGKASVGSSKPNAPVPTADPAKGPVTTVDGVAAQTRWGPVQVQLEYQQGRIAAVKLLKQPTTNAMDAFIGSRALPVLINETVAAQSAKIDMVSGATFTSGGYLSSLQSALDKGKP